jgi:hypothetical protein
VVSNYQMSPTVETWRSPKVEGSPIVRGEAFRGAIGAEVVTGKRFVNCTFDNCEFDGGMRDCYLIACTFRRCNFIRKPLADIWATKTAFSHCIFYGTQMRNFKTEHCTLKQNEFNAFTRLQDVRLLYASGLPRNKNLHFVQVADEITRINIETDMAHLTAHQIPFLERYVSWDKIRTLGKLPLFGISYSVLITVPLLLFLLAVYNRQIVSLKTLAQTEGSPAAQEMSVVSLLVSKLHVIPIPEMTQWIIVVTLLLGVASTLYTLACPSRIKEFSLVQWTDELHRSSINYLPLSWGTRPIRVLTGACYAVGGVGALVILANKVINAISFVVENSYH